jgi:hypothetical protein
MADRIDRETKSVAAKRNRLCREIDAHRQRWFCAQCRHEHGSLLVPNNGREQAVLDCIAGEDVAERRRDDAADTPVHQGVDGGFARGAACEIAPANKNTGLAPCRAIERKVGPFMALRIVAQIMQQEFSQSSRPRQLEKAYWNQLIRI